MKFVREDKKRNKFFPKLIQQQTYAFFERVMGVNNKMILFVPFILFSPPLHLSLQILHFVILLYHLMGRRLLQ